MTSDADLIVRIYAGFNARDIDAVFSKAVLEEAGSRLGSSHRDLRAFLVSTDRHPAGIGLDVGHFNHR